MAARIAIKTLTGYIKGLNAQIEILEQIKKETKCGEMETLYVKVEIEGERTPARVQFEKPKEPLGMESPLKPEDWHYNEPLPREEIDEALIEPEFESEVETPEAETPPSLISPDQWLPEKSMSLPELKRLPEKHGARGWRKKYFEETGEQWLD